MGKEVEELNGTIGLFAARVRWLEGVRARAAFVVHQLSHPFRSRVPTSSDRLCVTHACTM